MATQSLSTPTLEINDQPVAYVPNTIVFKPGLGDRTVKPQCAGGNSIEIVISENAETKASMVKFQLKDTAENIDLSKGWTNNINGNTIRIYQGEASYSFRHMVVTTEPENKTGTDGSIDLEFMGTPSL